MRAGETVILRENDLRKAGVNLDAMGITNRKNRPYVVIASNRQMTWLAPLTTVLKHGHGRVVVQHVTRQGSLECEVITTDMFSLSTPVLEKVGHKRGTIGSSWMMDVKHQLKHSISLGRLGVPA